MMTIRTARSLLSLLVILLMIGTQMPGPWRNAIAHGLHAPDVAPGFAHLSLFAGIAWVASARPLAWRWPLVLLLALSLALLTEGLQFFAIDRHPSWRDVGIDLCGACLGMLLGRVAGWAGGIGLRRVRVRK